MKKREYILTNEKEVLTYLKTKYPLFHLSNVFFRDIQFGIQSLLERKGMDVKYPEAEEITKSFVDQLQKEVQKGQTSVTTYKNMLKVDVAEKIFFDFCDSYYLI